MSKIFELCRAGLREMRRPRGMLSFTCMYSVVTSVLLLCLLFNPDWIMSPRLTVSGRARRIWWRDSIIKLKSTFSKGDPLVTTTTTTKANINTSATIPFLDDALNEDGEGVLNGSVETPGTELMPTETTIIPGYFLLDTNEPFTRRCRQCSLVSNSGHLYESGAGVDIDKADCVLRMNTAPVTGWEEDVGSRTDMRIIGHVNLPRGLMKSDELRKEILADEKTRARFVVVPWLYTEKVNMTTNMISKVARDLKKSFPEVEFVFQTEEKYNEYEERFRLETGHSRSEMNTWFSTGFVSMLFALDVCEEVQVFGLANRDYCAQHPKSKVPYHYYEPKLKTECSYILQNEQSLDKGHKFVTERAMMARWSLVFKINFHYPSWRATIANTSAQIADTPYFIKYAEVLKSGKQIPKPAEYIIKDGRRFRIIRKHVRKVPPPPPPNDVETANNSKTADKVEAEAPQIKRRVVRRVVKKYGVKPKEETGE